MTLVVFAVILSQKSVVPQFLVPNVLLPFTRLKDATKCGVLNATLDSVGAEGLLKTAYTTHTIMSGSDKMAVAELPEMWEILNVVETSETII